MGLDNNIFRIENDMTAGMKRLTTKTTTTQSPPQPSPPTTKTKTKIIIKIAKPKANDENSHLGYLLTGS